MDETKRSKQEALDKRYIRMASIWAENSYCQRRQVGALIVKDKMIISDGYNGTPSGFENVCEDEKQSHQTLCAPCRSQCHYQDSTLQQQQQRCHNVRHGLSLYRMCQTYHPGRNQACRILRKISFGRRHRTAETCRYRSNIHVN